LVNAWSLLFHVIFAATIVPYFQFLRSIIKVGLIEGKKAFYRSVFIKCPEYLTFLRKKERTA